MNTTRLIKGVSLISVAEHVDHRGCLAFLEYPTSLPFVVKRMFTLTECPDNAARAEHSNPADQVIIAAAGAVHVELDNGHDKKNYRLDKKSGSALWIRAGVWVRLRGFEPQSVVIVLSPIEYNASAQFDAPQPHLIVDPE